MLDFWIPKNEIYLMEIELYFNIEIRNHRKGTMNQDFSLPKKKSRSVSSFLKKTYSIL